eukprot:6071484-Alexandrium_andersonii.AAC.1
MPGATANYKPPPAAPLTHDAPRPRCRLTGCPTCWASCTRPAPPPDGERRSTAHLPAIGPARDVG